MTPDFDDLLAKAEAATPGPWEPWDSLYIGMKAAIVVPGFDPLVTIAEVRTNYDDAKFLAAASPDVIRALVLRLREAEAALRPFQQVGWPSVSDPDDNEGDIPDFTEVDVVASGFDLNAADYMVDPLTVGDFRRVAAYFTAHDTTEGGE